MLTNSLKKLEDSYMNATAEFNYKGFDPEIPLISQSNTVLNALYDLSPSDSSIEAVIEKIENIYHCKISIACQSGPFEAEFDGRSVHEAVENVTTSLLKKVSQWRDHRFGGHADGIMH